MRYYGIATSPRQAGVKVEAECLKATLDAAGWTTPSPGVSQLSWKD